MSLFKCPGCGCIENTATGDYWVPVGEGTEPKCSECATGKWHGLFHKQTPEEAGLVLDKLGYYSPTEEPNHDR